MNILDYLEVLLHHRVSVVIDLRYDGSIRYTRERIKNTYMYTPPRRAIAHFYTWTWLYIFNYRWCETCDVQIVLRGKNQGISKWYQLFTYMWL